MSSCPLVCIVVLNWNRPDDTIECVQSLQKTDYANAEILIVDNGSTDESTALFTARLPGIQILQTGQNLGYTGGNNFGFEYALKQGADYVFVLNNDTTVDPDCIQRLVDAGETYPETGVLGCFVFAYAPPRPFLYAGLHTQKTLGRPSMGGFVGEEIADKVEKDAAIEEVVPIDAAHGCAFVIKRAALERVKGFDPKFFAVHEEVDLSMRVQEAGYQVVAVPQARIYHKVGATFGSASPNRTYYDVRNKVHYFNNRAAAQAARLPGQFWVRYTLSGLGRSVKQLLKGDRPQAQAVFQGTLDGILHRQGPR